MIDSNPTTNTQLLMRDQISGKLFNAPETFNSSKGHSFEADVYSFGAVMFYMLSGELQVPRQIPQSLVTDSDHYFFLKVHSMEIPETIKENYGEKLAEIVKEMLNFYPNERKSLDQILEIIEKH